MNFYELVCISKILKLLRILLDIPLREKCPYSELFWSAFFRIRTEYGEILSVFLRIQSDAGKCGPE